MRRRGVLYRLGRRLVVAWCAAHGFTVVDAELAACVETAGEALQAFARRSGHLTRGFHAGKVVQRAAAFVSQAMVKAHAAVWE